MIRDVALGGIGAFRSDIDLVVETDPERLRHTLADYNWRSTRFGGHRVLLSHWIVDVWPVCSTWALVEKHVSGEDLADLPKTTFFNWDAAVYDIDKNRLYTRSGYIEAIYRNTLDINLRANPNPTGMAMRTMKLLLRWNASLSPSLSVFLAEHLEQDQNGVVGAARDGLQAQFFLRQRLVHIRELLEAHLENTPLVPFQMPDSQGVLPSPFDFGKLP